MNATASRFPVGDRPGTPTLRSVELAGPAGRLEALLNTGSPDAACAALICHPNPAYGGTMHHKVVYRAMKVLNGPEWGWNFPVLRFNFRGTGLSQGTHDGKAEVGDVLAALEWLDSEFHLPLIVAGFSFGAAMALWSCCGPQKTSTNVRALVALGLPTHADGRDYHYRFLHEATASKLFISGDRDDFGPEEQLRQVVATAADPKQLVFIPDSDHFFTGKLEAMQGALAGWMKEHVTNEQSKKKVKEQR